MTEKRTAEDIVSGCVGAAIVAFFAIFWGAVFVIVVIGAVEKVIAWVR